MNRIYCHGDPMKKRSVSRRDFLRSATAMAGACTIFSGNVLGANERIRVGFIGTGNRGSRVYAELV